jgi:LuxR family transcriptional regulator, maltose regulon positive regulatory protein
MDPERTWIRESKLAPRRPQIPAVERERLLTQLAARPTAPIVLISASAGYGKSILASQWCLRCRRRVAWIGLDHGDNDPVVFLNYVAQALDRLAPIAPALLAELAASAPRIDQVVLPALAVELARVSPVELVFDDLDELSDPRSLAALSFLLGEIPRESQVVIVTRADPALALARYRISGDLLEVRADNLAFDADEVRALAASSGAPFSDRALESLRQRTEGWPAGVALAMQAVDDQAAGDAVVESIGGRQRQIADYLMDVVMARESEQHRAFLLATSVLRRMTPSLCDAVHGTIGSSAVLRELELSNSFVIALDDHREWYRYHHLFGQFLRAELERLHPELVPVYLERAARWYERDGGDPGEAFRCAHECGDLERAGRIALASWDAYGSRGQLETVRLWLLDCSDSEIASEPQLALAAAWVYALLGDSERAERFALAAAQGDIDVPSADGATSLRSSLANLRTAIAPRGIRQMLADAQFVYAAEREPARSRWLPGACRAIGIANLLLGRPDEATTALREALLLTSGRPEFAHARILPLSYLAFAAADAGDWSEARKRAREARALAAANHLDGMVTAAPVFTARAMALAHDGDFVRARAELAQALGLGHLVRGARWWIADMNIRWGSISVQLGERAAARDHAGDARAALHEYPDPGTLPARLAALEAQIARADMLQLTPAELQVAAFLPTHRSLREIADALGLSRTTVKTHVAAIYLKLGVTSRSEAVVQLAEARIDPPFGQTVERQGTPGI